jgi:hypothetical protein
MMRERGEFGFLDQRRPAGCIPTRKIYIITHGHVDRPNTTTLQENKRRKEVSMDLRG